MQPLNEPPESQHHRYSCLSDLGSRQEHLMESADEVDAARWDLKLPAGPIYHVTPRNAPNRVLWVWVVFNPGIGLSVAFSPDGKTLASASEDRTVKLWDAGSGAVLQTLEGHSKSVSAVGFSPDGKTLASASHDKTVKLWDAGSGAVLQTFDVDSFIRSISFSIDGTVLRTDRGLLNTGIFLL